MLTKLLHRYPGRAELRLSGTREVGESIPHFLLVGEDAYRLEATHPYLDDAVFDDVSPETKARICFNDAAGGKVLLEFFASLWESASEVGASAPETAAG